MTPPRVEEDSLGKREVPSDAYYGIQTVRARENFPVSGLTASRHLTRAYAIVKLAAVRTNSRLGTVDARRSSAIEQAAREMASGKFDREMIVDIFQAGAGTSFHMNVNEVLANRALEILGLPRGEYAELSPNDHVNRGQSTNDTFPTATQLATLFGFAELRRSVEVLASSLRRKGEEFAKIPKAGRTHLKDAMPVTLGVEFHAYASTLERQLQLLPAIEKGLAEVPLGGSAVGSGVNTVPGFRAAVIEELARLSGFPIMAARDPFEAMQSRWSMGAASGWLRGVALELVRIANDLRLLASGPATGFDEIRLPEIQPGSSIMPGKVNPSAAECLTMVAFHVVGADLATALSIQAGQLEINVMMPLAAAETLVLLRHPDELPAGLREDGDRRDHREPRTARALPHRLHRPRHDPHAPVRLPQGRRADPRVGPHRGAGPDPPRQAPDAHGGRGPRLLGPEALLKLAKPVP